MNNPLVSIIIPTYNRAHLIGETLDSVLAQTYSNWECIVVDDGSTDNTSDLLKSYCETDIRYQYHHRPTNRPKGANACRNYGFEVSKGEYIQYLDSDDLISLNKIKEQIITLTNQNRKDIATCSWGYFSKNILDSEIKANEPYYSNYQIGLDLLNVLGVNREYFPVHVYLIKRNIIEISGGWDESINVNQDGEYFCRVLLNCVDIVFVKDAVVYYRINSDISTSSSNTREKMEQRIESWKIINNHILKKHKINNSKYVRNAKENLFVVVLKKYPELIKMNKNFFYYQILKKLLKNNFLINFVKKNIKY